MSTKTKSQKLTNKEKKQAAIEASRKARMQWYMLGGFLVAAIIVAIVLITIYTEGTVFSQHG